MAANISTIDKLHRIETFYRQGFQSELIEQALDKLLEQEEMRAKRVTDELAQRLRHHLELTNFPFHVHDGAEENVVPGVALQITDLIAQMEELLDA